MLYQYLTHVPKTYTDQFGAVIKNLAPISSPSVPNRNKNLFKYIKEKNISRKLHYAVSEED